MTTTTYQASSPTSETTTGATTGASAVARTVLHDLETAWNAADGAAFGAVFAADASFVTIRGEHVVGSGAIGAGHAAIFASIYAGSTNRMELVDATEVAPGVVVAVSTNTLECPSGPLVGTHQARSTVVIARTDGCWRAVACHNTLVA